MFVKLNLFRASLVAVT